MEATGDPDIAAEAVLNFAQQEEAQNARQEQFSRPTYHGQL